MSQLQGKSPIFWDVATQRGACLGEVAGEFEEDPVHVGTGNTCTPSSGVPAGGIYRLNQMRWAPRLLRSIVKVPPVRSARPLMKVMAREAIEERPVLDPYPWMILTPELPSWRAWSTACSILWRAVSQSSPEWATSTSRRPRRTCPRIGESHFGQNSWRPASRGIPQVGHGAVGFMERLGHYSPAGACGANRMCGAGERVV